MDASTSIANSLTPREQQVLRLLVEGLPNKGIALRLSMSPHTVADHLRRVFEALGVKTRAAAAARGALEGFGPKPQAPAIEAGASIIVGLDPGVETGYATWDRELRRLVEVSSKPIHAAMTDVRALHDAGRLHSVVFEDARQRTWYGSMDAKREKYGEAVREGVGSVKRDCTIWEHYLTDLGVTFTARPPQRGATKWSSDYFYKVTKWTARTNNHGRDAAALVYGK